jgi:hypothetical protein
MVHRSSTPNTFLIYELVEYNIFIPIYSWNFRLASASAKEENHKVRMDPEEVYYMRAPGRLGGLEGVEYYIT